MCENGMKLKGRAAAEREFTSYKNIQYNTIQKICKAHYVCQLAESETRAVACGKLEIIG